MENTQTKTCSKCGRTLSIENFYKRSRDGKPYSYCKECVKVLNAARRITPPPDSENPLSVFTPRQLMQELKRRGYTGKLYIQQVADLDRL